MMMTMEVIKMLVEEIGPLSGIAMTRCTIYDE
jgi:hypothetical protein